MPATPTTLDDLLAHELACSRRDFELLREDEVVGFLRARFRLLTEQGWDWASALLLATEVGTPVHETAALAPRVPAAIVPQ